MRMRMGSRRSANSECGSTCKVGVASQERWGWLHMGSVCGFTRKVGVASHGRWMWLHMEGGCVHELVRYAPHQCIPSLIYKEAGKHLKLSVQPSLQLITSQTSILTDYYCASLAI